jgi:alpha-beta hydrolase superfamily lysophospholipase
VSKWILTVALASVAAAALAAEPPSRPGIDAPELAPLGESAVGVRTLALVDRNQPDVAATVAAGGTPTSRDRRLTVDVWYPAQRPPHGEAVTYHGELTGEARSGPFKFSVPGLAYRDAAAAGKGHPLVVVSHGAGNHPAGLTWLTENLASKGYVVAAIHHDDPPYGDPLMLPVGLLRRPLDIAFVVRSLQASLGAEGIIDPQQLALVGYSFGGYGVLTAAGAALDPAAVEHVPGKLMAPFARGGAREGELHVTGLRAVVALAPAGGAGRVALDANRFASVKAPLLLIVGDQDHAVGYAPGVRTIFEAATGADRYLLTFHQAGHGIGLNPAPPEMRSQLWDLDWFEDPVWRKDRINQINLHFITAFLDGILKHDAAHLGYLDVTQVESDDGVWPPPGPAHWSDTSPGTGGITVWKGFQNGHSAGLRLEHRGAAAP